MTTFKKVSKRGLLMAGCMLLPICDAQPSGSAVAPNGAQPFDLRLADRPRFPGLSLVVTIPAGWSAEFGKDSNVAYLSRVGSGGTEAIVVMATALRGKERGKGADEIFDPKFLEAMAGILDLVGVTSSRRVREPYWDGALFEYPLPSSITKGRFATNVRNWVMVSDGYLVQFQCYYYRYPGFGSEQQERHDRSMARDYEWILASVRKETKQ